MKAIGLLSGGLDSALALKLVLDQGIDVVALQHVLPFNSEKMDYSGQVADRLGIELVRIEAGEDYIEIIRNPEYGYGANMNPCIDCRIYMLRGAKKLAEEIGADFIITGDVLGQRPMSQRRESLHIEEHEADLVGMIFRPLSARILPKTIPEQKGWVASDSLMGIKGKSRRLQLKLAEKLGLEGYRFPDAGCLLTNKEFSSRLRPLFARQWKVTKKDIELLKIGRHYYHSLSRIIVGRNERENRLLLELKNPQDYVFEVPGCGSPVTVLQGPKGKGATEIAARLTARYSDADTEKVRVEYSAADGRESVEVEQELPEDLMLKISLSEG